MFYPLALSIFFIFTIPFTACAQDGLESASLSQAQELITDGKNLEAISVLNRVIDSVWDKIPFKISFATLTETPSKGFGMFNARENNAYSKDDAKILLYLEPIGYKFAPEKNNRFKFGFSMDLYLLTKDGKVIFNKEKFLNQELVSHVRNREFFLNVTLTLTGLDIGDYTIKLVTHDTIGKQQTETVVPITIKGEAVGSDRLN